MGPEVSVAAAARMASPRCVLVGDSATLQLAAEVVGVNPARLVCWDGEPLGRGRIGVVPAGPVLRVSDRRPGKPSRTSGAAQLEYVRVAFDLARRARSVLVTAPVSKAVIAHSGAPGAEGFLGHTEWLQREDGAPTSVMCFVAPEVATSQVTTHLPLAKVPRALSPARVAEATVQLARLLRSLGANKPRLAVCSLNPHAGESEMLGAEEAKAIVPGIVAARRALGVRARLSGPIGAETAYRKAFAGEYDGVVAMYHDQATVPMKLVAFGRAVNVTMGLSIVRTSVDHGTGYDIAWKNRADAQGMLSALQLGARMLVHRFS
ncbi:MAG: 4-hydroxythreonine-4-phosphate dehydrogenase PdxA [Polyangiaceae bacterium]|nr:4-hydroxythreonine-4-phosphate dehydrogenase PdxA [Polyangiaceae bacterium]